MSRPITERMAAAVAKITARRRTPRVFYLSPADFDEFAATKPGTVEEPFALPLGSKPHPMTCLAFEGIAVRCGDRKPDRHGKITSSLYSRCGISAQVPAK